MEPTRKLEPYGPPFFETDGYVSVWAAAVPLSRIPKGYFDEQFEDDNAPLTAFYAAFGFWFFDHDFMDTNGSPGRPTPFADVIGRCSYSSSFSTSAIAAAVHQGVEVTEWAVLLYDFRYEPSVTGVDRDSYMVFVGSFPYDKEAPSDRPFEQV